MVVQLATQHCSNGITMCVQNQWAFLKVEILNGFKWSISRRVNPPKSNVKYPCLGYVQYIQHVLSSSKSNTTVTLPPICWTWLELGHPAPCKVSLAWLYSTKSIKIQQTQLLEFDGFGVVRVNVGAISKKNQKQ